MNKSLVAIICSLSLGAFSQVGLCADDPSSDKPAAPPEPSHHSWCKEHPEKCEKMRELRRERHEWRQEKRTRWCNEHPEKCQKLKEEREQKMKAKESKEGATNLKTNQTGSQAPQTTQK